MSADPWKRGGGKDGGKDGGRGGSRDDGRPASPRATQTGSPWGARGDRPSREADRSTEPSPASPARVFDKHASDKLGRELRLYGFNAVSAVFQQRPEAIRKVYLAEARIPQLQPLLKWCAAQRVGYRVVEEDDLRKLAASSHHEGVVADVLRVEPMPLSDWLRDVPAGPQCVIWLDGVGNPHNLGAILRSAAHFGAAALLLPSDSELALSGAAARVAEGGAEAVTMVRLPDSADALAQLHDAGFVLAATVVEGGDDLFATALPGRLAFVLGAESEGMDRQFASACDLRLSIPGSGAVESLNVAAATAVLLAAWRHRR
jgi:TrmH RNA methyltransferase